MPIRPLSLTIAFLALSAQLSFAETTQPVALKTDLPTASQESESFKKAQRDARRMLNWWKYKLKNDPDLQNFQPPQIPQARLSQYSIEEERRTPKKK